MIDKDDIINTINEFMNINLEKKTFQRITRTKEELEDKLLFIQNKIQEWYLIEKQYDDWNIFKETQEKSLFQQAWSLKKSILYIKLSLKWIGYDMVYSSFPGHKVITFSNLSSVSPIKVHRIDPPRPFKVSKGLFRLNFNIDGDDELVFS